MSKIKAEIRKEMARQIDSDNAYFTVALMSPFDNSLLFETEIRHIFSSGTFHLDDENEAKCELVGVEPYDLQLALESNESTVLMAMLDQYYQPSQAILNLLDISDNFVWQDKQVCMSNLGICAGDVLEYNGDDIENVRFVDNDVKWDKYKGVKNKTLVKEELELSVNKNPATDVYDVLVNGVNFGSFDQVDSGGSYCYFPKRHEQLTGHHYMAIGQELNKLNAS